MPRPRKTDRHLPPSVYHVHGAYYLVKRLPPDETPRWHHLGRDYAGAMLEYARKIGQASGAGEQGTMAALLARVVADAEARQLSASTLKAYRRAVRTLTPVLVEFRPDQVRPKHIAQIMDAWRDKPAEANHLRTVLKLAFTAAVRAGQCDSNPVASIAPHPVRARTRYITDAEYRAIHQAAPPAMRCIMDLAYLTGQRISDVLAIRAADLTPDGIEITQQKTGHPLIIPWNPDLRAAVEAAQSLHSTAKLILLAQRNGRPRSYGGVRDLWERACLRAGVADAHLHDLRAKALTDAKAQGLDPQALGGHASESNTRRYLRGRERHVAAGPSFRQLDTGADKALYGKP